MRPSQSSDYTTPRLEILAVQKRSIFLPDKLPVFTLDQADGRPAAGAAAMWVVAEAAASAVAAAMAEAAAWAWVATQTSLAAVAAEMGDSAAMEEERGVVGDAVAQGAGEDWAASVALEDWEATAVSAAAAAVVVVVAVVAVVVVVVVVVVVM